MTIKSWTANMLTDDMDASLKFYCEVLGFEMVMSVPEQGPFDWCMLHLESVEVMLQTRKSMAEELALFQDMENGGALGFYIKVDDVHAMAKKLRAANVEVTKDINTTFYGATEFTIKDPNGFILTFAEMDEPPVE